MASSALVKLGLLVFLTMLQFFSSSGVSVRKLGLIPKFPKLPVKTIKPELPVNPTLPLTPKLAIKPEVIRAQQFGQNLANKYFGDRFIQGFRWGYKQGKRIHSVARKCEDFLQVLDKLSCSQPQQISPILSASPIVHCVVEVGGLQNGIEICVQYEDIQYPPEATCSLDQPNTLGSNCAP